MDSHRPEHIGAYHNMPALFRRRGYELKFEPLRPSHVQESDLVNGLTPEEIVSDLSMQFGKWELVAVRGDGGAPEVMVVFLILADSNAASKSDDFQSLFTLAEKRAKDVADGATLKEVLVVAPTAITTKPNLKQKMIVIARETAKKHPERCLRFHPYYVFSTVVPDQPCVPAHSVIPASEVPRYVPGFVPGARGVAPASVLPLIHCNEDAAAIWFGVRPRDFVLVMRPSETAGEFTPAVRYAV